MMTRKELDDAKMRVAKSKARMLARGFKKICVWAPESAREEIKNIAAIERQKLEDEK